MNKSLKQICYGISVGIGDVVLCSFHTSTASVFGNLTYYFCRMFEDVNMWSKIDKIESIGHGRYVEKLV